MLIKVLTPCVSLCFALADTFCLMSLTGLKTFPDQHFGPSGVQALPKAAGTNECGHYFGPSGAVQTVDHYFGPSETAVGNYFCYFSAFLFFLFSSSCYRRC